MNCAPTSPHPAPLQDCDYFRRAQLLGMPWRRLPQLHILHPIQKYLPRPPALSARVAACAAERAARRACVLVTDLAHGTQRLVLADQMMLHRAQCGG